MTVLRRGVAGPAVTGLVVLLGGVATAAGWLDWPALGRWLWANIGLIIAFAVAAALLAKAALRALRPARKPARALSWWVVAAAAAVVAGVAWGATTWLLSEADRAADPPAARVEAIKTGLGTAAGAAGVFALLLAVRRQWHQEHTSTAIELDAAEKRVTELYTKAVEQLGSAQAPVRLGGLYALERLAQNNPDQRQTIVNVLCAYLRMPYQLPGAPPADDADILAGYHVRVQEREVRLTAQGILSDHLRRGNPKNPSSTFWRDIDLNLVGAVLVDFSLSRCTVRTATFEGAAFIGNTYFMTATFTGNTYFMAASFTGDANFMAASFGGNTDFESATFTIGANFAATTFTGVADFGGVIFTRLADFRRATFTGTADFRSATFTSYADFESATFTTTADFQSATFTGVADFQSAIFTSDTYFDEATFALGVPEEVAPFKLEPDEDETADQQTLES